MSRKGRGWYRVRGRSRASLLVSLGVHLAAVVGLLNMVFRYDVGTWREEGPTATAPERLRYVRVVPQPSAGGPVSVSANPSRGPTATRRLRAPDRVPVGIPEPPSAAATAAAPGVEDRAGSAGRGGDVTVATGVQPSYTDPRLWPQPGPFTPIPKTTAQRTDSAVKAAFGIFADSLAIAEANKGRAPTDWTIERKGQKWGVDDRWIHLGKMKIPNAILALLPMNAQANPTFNDPVTRREAAFRRADIAYHANRAVSEDEFRRAVKRIRERKDRERAAAKATNASGDGPQPVATPTKTQN
ncbi:MAG: hypothetical protein ABR499_07270 [Gemmatimonadaceae bacterium]